MVRHIEDVIFSPSAAISGSSSRCRANVFAIIVKRSRSRGEYQQSGAELPVVFMVSGLGALRVRKARVIGLLGVGMLEYVPLCIDGVGPNSDSTGMQLRLHISIRMGGVRIEK